MTTQAHLNADHSNADHANANRIGTAVRRLAVGLGLAIGLAACSQAAPETEAANPAAETIAVEAPTNDPANTESADTESADTESADTDAPSTTLGSNAGDEVVPAAAPAPAPAPAPVVPVACTPDEQPLAAWMYASADLNIRTGPGVNNPAFTHLAAGELTEWAFYAGNGGCVRIPGSGVWWAVYLEAEGTTGWAHASYLLPEFVDPHGPVLDDDFHVDCVWLLNETCVEVIRDDFGGVAEVYSALDDNQVGWAQLACVYRADASACDVLSLIGFGFENNYGLGNDLTMTPTEALLDACSHWDGGDNADIALQCEELETREGGE